MKIESHTVDDVLVLKLQERRIDASTAVAFKAKLSEFLDDGYLNIIINLAEVGFVDSSGLGALVSALKEVGPQGEIKLCEVREGVRSIFELTRLDTVFDIHHSEKGAITSFHKEK